METCLARAASATPAEVQSVLGDIDGVPRRVLALRSYLRAGDVAARWSWTDDEIAAYERSPAHEEAMAALAWAQARFAERNPGFTLYVNTRVRSLDTQVQRWNGNASVAAAAQAMQGPAESACADDPDGFAAWVKAWRPVPPPNLAAPGLSAHGQGRAFDFQVMEGEVLVAGTDARRIDVDWIATGWARRLAEVMAESPAFKGPLTRPSEPWHYIYVPASNDAPAVVPDPNPEPESESQGTSAGGSA